MELLAPKSFVLYPFDAFVFLPNSVLYLTCNTVEATFPMLLTIFPLAIVFLPIWPSVYSMPLYQIVLEIATES